MELGFLKDNGYNIVKASKFLYNLKTIDKDGMMLRYKYNSRTDLLTNLITREDYVYGAFKLLELTGQLPTKFVPNASRIDAFKSVIKPMLKEMTFDVITVQKNTIYVIAVGYNEKAIIYRPKSDTYQMDKNIIKGLHNFLF